MMKFQDKKLKEEDYKKVLSRKEYYSHLYNTFFTTTTTVSALASLIAASAVPPFCITAAIYSCAALPGLRWMLQHRDFIKDFQIGYDKYRQNLYVRKALDQIYDEFLEEILNYIEKLPIEQDALNISLVAAEFLLAEGYICIISPFQIDRTAPMWSSEYGYRGIIQTQGAWVASGTGCCRHVNSFIRDLLSKKGIESYAISCIHFENVENYQKFDFCENQVNHLITGYVENGKMSLIDAINSLYSIEPKENYYQSENGSIFVPDFGSTISIMNQMPEIYPIASATTLEEITERRKDLSKILKSQNQTDLERLVRVIQFRTLGMLTLLDLEYGSTLEQERQKLKQYIQTINTEKD